LDKTGFLNTDNLSKKVQNNFKEINPSDIIVIFDNLGVAIHSYVYSGESETGKTTTSKNGETEIGDYSIGEVFDIYKPYGGVSTGYFTPVDDKTYVSVDHLGIPQGDGVSIGTSLFDKEKAIEELGEKDNIDKF